MIKMYKALSKKERENVQKINSRLHGTDYLSKDLKLVLEELSTLLGIENAIIFIEGKKKKEFIGDAKNYWKKYSKEIMKAMVEVKLTDNYLILEKINPALNRLLVIPIKEGSDFGFLIIINKRIDYGINQHNTEIVEILKKQIKFIIRKTKEREELFNILGKYIDKRQIAEIIENPGFLNKPEMINSVVLFADISGFTNLANEMSIEDVFNFLNKFFYESTKLINQNNGIVDKFVGDQIIGIFGLIDGKNRTKNAVNSAIQMQELFKKEFKNYGVGLKIALVKSKMLYGHIGGNYKSDLTVIGPGVNLASRICSYAKSGEILVNEFVVNKLKDDLNFQLKGYKKFKGFKKRYKIYSLIYS